MEVGDVVSRSGISVFAIDHWAVRFHADERFRRGLLARINHSDARDMPDETVYWNGLSGLRNDARFYFSRSRRSTKGRAIERVQFDRLCVFCDSNSVARDAVVADPHGQRASGSLVDGVAGADRDRDHVGMLVLEIFCIDFQKYRDFRALPNGIMFGRTLP